MSASVAFILVGTGLLLVVGVWMPPERLQGSRWEIAVLCIAGFFGLNFLRAGITRVTDDGLLDYDEGTFLLFAIVAVGVPSVLIIRRRLYPAVTPGSFGRTARTYPPSARPGSKAYEERKRRGRNA
jgi:hypothetical protein